MPPKKKQRLVARPVKAAIDPPELQARLEETRRSFYAEQELVRSPFVYKGGDAEARERLCRLLWTGDFREGVMSLEAAVPGLADALRSVTANSYRARAKHAASHQRHEECQLAGLLACVIRMQNQNEIPLLTVLLSVRAYATGTSQRFRDGLTCFFRGVLLSDTWVEALLGDAMRFDPGATYAVLDGVGAAMFDNLTIKIGYKAYSTQDDTGYSLDMTNWLTLDVPRALAPANFHVNAIWQEGTYVRYLSRGDFRAKFRAIEPSISANRRRRFVRFVQAAGAGTLFDRPNYVSTWKAHTKTQPAMFDRLQGSYADVEFELDAIRSRFTGGGGGSGDTCYLWLGGDGLSIDRMQHLIAQQSPKYLHSKPAVLPVLGLSPHGEYHVFHAGYRNYRGFVRVCATHLNNKQLVDDPLVSEYNPARFGIEIVMRAASEYLFDLCKTAGAESIDATDAFLAACERNVDMAWLVHFLYDFAYLWWDFKQAVRSNESKHLDMLWAEFVPLGRTTSANKTHYGVMAVMQVYYACALHPQLLHIYHGMRTLYTGGAPGTNTGWDMLPERVNLALKEDVTCQITRDLIQRRLQNHDLLKMTDAGLDAIVYESRSAARAKMKQMDADVALLRGLFVAKVGATWAAATRRNTESDLGIDSRLALPWEAVRKAHTTGPGGGEESVDQYVTRVVTRLAPWQLWRA